MKLRIRGNSLRLRLTRTEVDALANDGRVEDAIAFAPGESNRLVYAIVAREANGVSAEWTGRAMTVTLPSSLARDWATSERVGIEHEQPIGDAGTLRILVEKDFACLTPRKGEDDENAFPNPNASC
jgi:hypothetical protein